jgi:hypothetical protein
MTYFEQSIWLKVSAVDDPAATSAPRIGSRGRSSSAPRRQAPGRLLRRPARRLPSAPDRRTASRYEAARAYDGAARAAPASGRSSSAGRRSVPPEPSGRAPPAPERKDRDAAAGTDEAARGRLDGAIPQSVAASEAESGAVAARYEDDESQWGRPPHQPMASTSPRLG